MSRLDKLLTERGLGTRKEVRKLVKRGFVEVDGEVMTRYEKHVEPGARIVVDGRELLPLPTVAVWHKPAGIISSVRDDWGRIGLETALPEAWRGRLHPVGRLDAETQGLLLFSGNGRLTQWMLHPKRAVPRTYLAVVEGAPTEALSAALRDGVRTAEGVFSAEVEQIEGAAVTLTVTEGKHRMVRRMLANAGFPVLELTRLRFGGFSLGDLPEGEARPMSEGEAAWLRERRAPID